MTTRYRTAILLWALFFTLACWVVVHTTNIRTELALLLPESPSVTEQLLVDHIRQGSTSRLILLGLKGADQDTLARASKRLAANLRNNPLISLVHNGDMSHVRDDFAVLFKHRYLLSPNITATKFQQEELKSTLKRRLLDVTSFLPSLMKNQTTDDVTGEFLDILKMWALAQALNRHRGVWISSQGNTALLTVETTVSGFALDAQEQIQQDLLTAVSQINTSLEQDQQIELLATGPSVFAVESRRTIKEEARWLSMLATILVVTFLFITYRSPTLIALTIVPLASGLLMGILTINLVFGFIHGVTLAFGATLIGVAIDYPIHVISHLSSKQSPFSILRQLWPVIALGAITTALGYCAMLFSGFPGLSQLGLFAIIGLFTSALVTRFILPRMIPTHLVVSPVGLSLISFTHKLSKMVVLLPIIFALAIGYLTSSSKVFWEHDVSQLSPIPQETKERDRWLRQEVGAIGSHDLVVLTGPTEESVLQESEKLIPFLKDQKHRGHIIEFELAAQYLPSIITQRTRQKLLPGPDVLRTRIEAAQKGFPFKKGVFEPFIRDVGRTKDQAPVNSHTFQGTSFGLKLNSLIFLQEDKWIGLVRLHGVKDQQYIRTLLEKRGISNLRYLDLKSEANHLINTYRDEMVRFLCFGAIAIILVLSVRLRSALVVLRIVGTVAVSIATVLAILHMLDERISLFHLSSLLLVIGIGLDYILFFHHHHHGQEARSRTTWAILICSSTTIMVFGLLAFSQTPVLHSIGLTAALGSLCCLVFSSLSAGKEKPAYR